MQNTLRRLSFTRHVQQEVVFDEQLMARTDDGMRFALYRIGAKNRSGPAVLLLHGLSGCRHAFAMPGRSVAHYLAARGFDCFVAELRGAGASDNPQWRWDMHDHVEHDLLAIIRCIQEVSGAKTIHTVGHSMGGILLLCYGMSQPHAPIASIVTVASALDYRLGNSVFAPMLRILPMVERLAMIPAAPFYATLSHLVGRVPLSPLSSLNIHVHPSNIEPEMVRQLYRLAIGNLATPLLKSLAASLSHAGLHSRDGSLCYIDHLPNVSLPVAFFAGSNDVQAPLAAVEATAAALPHAALFRFGRQFGHVDNYGHYDLLVGKRAPDEVWPHLAHWLRQRQSTPAVALPLGLA